MVRPASLRHRLRARCRGDRAVGPAAGPPRRPGRAGRGHALGRGGEHPDVEACGSCSAWSCSRAASPSVLGGITSGTVPMVLLGALAGFVGVADAQPGAGPAGGPRLSGTCCPGSPAPAGSWPGRTRVRNPRRTAATASALMIGVALVGGITVFAASGKWSVSHSFDKEFRGDLVAGDRCLGLRRGQPAAGRPTWPAPTGSRPPCRASSPRPRSVTA